MRVRADNHGRFSHADRLDSGNDTGRSATVDDHVMVDFGRGERGRGKEERGKEKEWKEAQQHE